MNPLRKLTGVVGKIIGTASRFWNRLLATGGVMGFYPGWTAARQEQVRQYHGWTLLAVNAICREVAKVTPQVAYVVDAEEAEEHREKCVKQFGRSRGAMLHARRFLTGEARRKSLTHVDQQEDLELVPSSHPLVRLLRRPNPKETEWSFYFKIVMFLELTGSAYLWRVRNKLGKVIELYVIPSQWMQPRSGKDRNGEDQIVAWYDCRPTGGFGMAGTARFWADEIIHVAKPHPDNPIDGFSTLSGIGEWVDGSVAIDRSRRARFEQGPMPGGVVSIDKEAKEPSPQFIDRFKADFRSKYSGYERHGDVMVMGPGWEWSMAGASPAEMDWINSFDQFRDSIMAAFGVGKTQVGIAEVHSRAEVETLRANFIYSTINPIFSFVGQVFTRELAHEYDERLRVFWPDAAPDDRAQRLAEYTGGAQFAAVTPNDYRQNVLGLEPYENGGDDPIAPMGLAPLPLQSGEEDIGLDLAALQALGRAPAASEPAEGPEMAPGGDQQGQNRVTGLLDAANGNGRH